MKKENLLTKVDYTIDRVTLDNENIQEVNTYYNDIQNLLTSEDYLNSASEPDILLPRRRALEVLFANRVEFIIRERLNIMRNYIDNYQLYFISPLAIERIKEYMPELFDITFYFNYMTNPIVASDYALAINSILYNTIFDNIRIDNREDHNQQINSLNNFMKMSLSEFINVLNGLYLEAQEVYYNAGVLQEENNNLTYTLTGNERKQALIEAGRPDLIDTDVKVERR